jgi:hypothetical protein
LISRDEWKSSQAVGISEIATLCQLNRAAQESARGTDCIGEHNDAFVAALRESSFRVTESGLFGSSGWHISVQEVRREEDWAVR